MATNNANKTDNARFGKAAAFVIDHIADLSGSAAKVYLVLCMLCGYHDRHVHVSYPRLMALAGISKNPLIKALNELEVIGAITRKSGNVGRTNDYYLPLEPGSKSEPTHENNPAQKVSLPRLKKCTYPGSKSEPRTEKSLIQKSIQEARRAQPHGQAGGALATAAAATAIGDSKAYEHQTTCPSCGAPSPAGEGCCPSCGWDYGQLELPSSEPTGMCPDCHIGLQPDGTCWRCGRAPGKEKGSGGDPSLDE